MPVNMPFDQMSELEKFRYGLTSYDKLSQPTKDYLLAKQVAMRTAQSTASAQPAIAPAPANTGGGLLHQAQQGVQNWWTETGKKKAALDANAPLWAKPLPETAMDAVFGKGSNEQLLGGARSALTSGILPGPMNDATGQPQAAQGIGQLGAYYTGRGVGFLMNPIYRAMGLLGKGVAGATGASPLIGSAIEGAVAGAPTAGIEAAIQGHPVLPAMGLGAGFGAGAGVGGHLLGSALERVLGRAGTQAATPAAESATAATGAEARAAARAASTPRYGVTGTQTQQELNLGDLGASPTRMTDVPTMMGNAAPITTGPQGNDVLPINFQETPGTQLGLGDMIPATGPTTTSPIGLQAQAASLYRQSQYADQQIARLQDQINMNSVLGKKSPDLRAQLAQWMQVKQDSLDGIQALREGRAAMNNPGLQIPEGPPQRPTSPASVEPPTGTTAASQAAVEAPTTAIPAATVTPETQGSPQGPSEFNLGQEHVFAPQGTSEGAVGTGETIPEGIVKPSGVPAIDSALQRQVDLLGVESPLNPTSIKSRGLFGEFMAQKFSAVDTWLRSLGPGGQKVAGVLRTSENVAATSYGHFAASVWEPVNKLKLSTQQWDNLRDVLRGTAETTDTKVSEAAQYVKKYLDDALQHGKDIGMTLTTKEGADIPFEGRPNYFPKLYDWSKIETQEGYKPDVLKRLVDSKQADNTAQAIELLDRYKRDQTKSIFAPTASFQREMVLDLPKDYEIPAQQEILRYARSYAQQDAIYSVMGGKNLPVIRAALQELQGAQPKDNVALVTDIVNKFIGQHHSAVDDAAVNLLLNVNSARSLTLAAIPNISQNINTVVKAGWRAVRTALESIGKDPEAARQFALKAGAVFDPEMVARTYGETAHTEWVGSSGPLGKMMESFAKGTEHVAEGIMKYTGFNFTERMNQTIAANAGKFWAQDMFNQAMSGQKVGAVSKVFAEAGIDLKQALERGGLTEDDLLNAGRYIMRVTQFPKSKLDVPLWTQSPWGKVVFQFQRFSYQNTKFISKEVWGEAKKYVASGGKEGSVKALATYIALAPLFGIPVGTVRDYISGRERPTGVFNTMVDAVGWVGGWGMFDNWLQSLSQGGDRLAAQALGPTGGLITTAGGALSGLYNGTKAAATGNSEGAARGYQQAARDALRLLPNPLGYSLASGKLPAGLGPITPLQKVINPDNYDPTGAKAASREYNKAKDNISKLYVKGVANGNLKDFYAAIAKSGMTNAQINSLVGSDSVQLAVINEKLKRLPNNSPERAQLEARKAQMEQQKVQRQVQSVPTQYLGPINSVLGGQ